MQFSMPPVERTLIVGAIVAACSAVGLGSTLAYAATGAFVYTNNSGEHTITNPQDGRCYPTIGAKKVVNGTDRPAGLYKSDHCKTSSGHANPGETKNSTPYNSIYSVKFGS